MFGIFINLFTKYFYQPFFNLLVAIYLGLKILIPEQVDMGIAVILFTIAFRILWLPISLSSDRSEKERQEISEKVATINATFTHDPVRQRQEIKKLFRTNRKIVFFSFIDIFFQVLVALMLYRIFSTGLEGADFHLLYKFIPKITEPFNLIFIGKYDLSKPNIFLNLIQTLCFFVAEVLSTSLSPFPITRKDLTTVFTIPALMYVFFSFMPAGKKLFVITTLMFSIMLMVAKQVKLMYHKFGEMMSTLPARLNKANKDDKPVPEDIQTENGI